MLEDMANEWRVIGLKKRHPFDIAAMEEVLLESVSGNSAPNTIVFHEWTPCISISNNQSIEDVNFEQTGKQGVCIVRTLVGGRAVYHDGKHSLSFCAALNTENLKPENTNSAILFKYCLVIIVNGLKKAGIAAEIHEQNYIRVNGKKLSGTALKASAKGVVFHGSLLYDVPNIKEYVAQMLSLMNLYDHPKEKIQSDIEEILTSIRAHNPSISREELCHLLAREFAGDKLTYGHLSKEEKARLKVLANTKYNNANWNNGGTQRGLCWRPYGPIPLSATRGENPS